MSVDQVLTNTADASMDQVSPPASNFVDVGGSHGTVMSLGLGPATPPCNKEAHLRLETLRQPPQTLFRPNAARVCRVRLGHLQPSLTDGSAPNEES